MNEQSDEEQDIGRLLRAAGPRRELPDELRQGWEQAFEQELAPVLARRRQVRRRTILGLCASVVVAVTVLLFNVNPPAIPAVIAHVTHAGGDHELHGTGVEISSLQAGQLLSPESRVSTGDNGQVALRYNGYDLRLNTDTTVTLEAERIRLQAGEIYVGDDPLHRPQQGRQQGPQHKLLIETAHGTVRDIGTQFTVALNAGQTVTTVRRGTVLVNPGGGSVQVTAPGESAIRISMDSDQQVHQQAVAASGADWRWIYAGGPGFELEGSSAHDFLQWSVGETGLRLEFATEAAEIYARTTLLHGDLADLDPEQAVDPVLAATDLQAQRGPGNTLLVSLGFRG